MWVDPLFFMAATISDSASALLASSTQSSSPSKSALFFGKISRGTLIKGTPELPHERAHRHGAVLPLGEHLARIAKFPHLMPALS